MTKFDSILTDLCEANNYPAPGAQQPAGTQNQQPARPVTGTQLHQQLHKHNKTNQVKHKRKTSNNHSKINRQQPPALTRLNSRLSKLNS